MAPQRNGGNGDGTASATAAGEPFDMIDMFSVHGAKPATILWQKNQYLNPLSPLDDANPIIEFTMQPSSLDFARLNRIRLKVKFKVVKNDGTAIEAGDKEKFTVTDLGLFGFFSDLKIFLNGIVVESTNGMWIHQNQIWMYTTKSGTEIQRDFELAGVVLNEKGVSDAIDFNKEQSSYKSRQKTFELSNEVTWTCPIRTPLMMDSQRKLLPTNVSMRIVLTRASNNQIIRVNLAGDTGKYAIKITECQLIIPKVRIDNDSALAIEQMMRKRDVVYRFNRFQSSYFTMAAGIQSTILETILSANSPLCTYVTMCDVDRFQGLDYKNPVLYSDFNLREMKLSLEEETEIREAIKVTAQYVHEAILALYEGLDILHHPTRTIPITVYNFKNGFNIYLFNHTNSTVIANYSDLQSLKRGNIRFQIDFSATNTNAIVIINHMIFVSEVKITHDRRVLHNY
jgi:hypothetical protein